MINTNTIAIWLAFFFIYCILGWIWESCYVSIRQRHWINRGFLHGPWLPIYGFGAVIILLITLPVQDKPIFIYLYGMIGATILEYVTGVLMESLFHTRYWDYSHQPFNLNGHICLGCSLGWGAFSLLLVKVIHQPINEFVLQIPSLHLMIMTSILLILFIIDIITSLKEALNFKALSERNIWVNEQLQSIQSKLETLTEQLIPKEILEINQTLPKWREAIVDEWETKHHHQLNRIDTLLTEIEKINQSNQSVELTNKLHEIRLEAQKNSEKKYRQSLRITWRNPNLVQTNHPDLFQKFFNQKKK